MSTSEQAITRNGIEFIVQYYYEPEIAQTIDTPSEYAYIEITSVTLRGKEILEHLPHDVIQYFEYKIY